MLNNHGWDSHQLLKCDMWRTTKRLTVLQLNIGHNYVISSSISIVYMASHHITYLYNFDICFSGAPSNCNALY